jgi:hypothetical protein
LECKFYGVIEKKNVEMNSSDVSFVQLCNLQEGATKPKIQLQLSTYLK